MPADPPHPPTAGEEPAPRVTLGPGFEIAPLLAGRYAVAIQRRMHGTHARQVLDERSTSSFVLELVAGGVVTACRGWRYDFRNAGPQVRTEDRYREQRGYRGKYRIAGGIAELELAFDDGVCPHVFEGDLVLARAPTLKLRCAAARPTSPGPLTTPVLLCQSIGDRPSELDPYVVEQIAPPGWFALGGGNGLRVRMTGRPVGAQAGSDVRAEVEVPTAPLDAHAWEHDF